MSKLGILSAIAFGVGVLCIGARANAAAAHDLHGYECMALNLTQQQMMDPSIHIPIRSAPSESAPVTGNAIATVIAATPTVRKGGYLKVLQLNGRSGWIDGRYLKAWTNPGGNGQRCYPAVLASGRIGFDYR